MALAWYNEPDPGKAQWLRELMKAGVIAPGDVDERSIREVKANELVGYTQRHFFAGIGVWSYALRQAGWPDDRPVDTGSCPCPSFSEAGKGEGFDDDRHLWPVWDTLIGELKPTVLFGEQSHAAIGFGWLDLVCGNLEAKGYAVAAAVLGAHSVGAPHRRQRLYFCADTRCASRPAEFLDESRIGLWRRKAQVDSLRTGPSDATGHGPNPDGRNPRAERQQRGGEQRLLAEDCGTGDCSDTEERGLAMCGSAPWNRGYTAQSSESERTENAEHLGRGQGSPPSSRPESGTALLGHGSALGVDLDAKCEGLEGHFGDVREWRGPGWLDPLTARSVAEAGATRGFWRDCDWWYGRDSKFRSAQPRLLKVVAGSARCMGYLCSDGDGNSEAQEEEVNETTETDPTQSMPILRCNHDQEAIQRGTGGLDCLPAEKVLQPGLHGEVDGRPNQESYSAKQSETINKEAQAILRTLRHHKEAAGCSSSGRKSPEQFGYEFADAMRLLPSAITFAKLHRHGGASENLFTLLSPDDAQRLMRDTPITDAEAWRSLTEESKTGLVLGFAEGRFVISDEGPLASGAAARVLRLRGYGDSIVAPLAGAFIKAYLEARRRF